MAIDFSGALIGDNYSTGVLAKLNATDIANAVWLDSAYTSYTGTITTGAKRITTGGVIEQYNGSAWVALSVGYVLKAGDTMTGNLSVPRIDQSNGSINFASLGNGSTSWQIGTQTAGKPLDIFIGGAVIAQFSDTGLAVTGALSSSWIFSLTGGSVNPIVVSGATTGESYGKFTNTSGQTVFGVNNSVAGTLYSGGTAYASFFGSNVAKNVDLIVNGVTVASLSSTGLTVVGISTVTQSKVTVNTNNLYEAVTLTNSSNTSSGMQILTKNGYGNLVSIDMQQVDNGTGADDGVMNIKIATNSTLATVASVSSTGLAVTGTLTVSKVAGGITVDGLSNNSFVYMKTGRSFTVNRNWEIAVDQYAEGHWTVTPSTAIGGSIYTTPIVDVSSTGLAVTGTLSATGNSILGSGSPLTGGASARWITLNSDVASIYGGGVISAIDGVAKGYFYANSSTAVVIQGAAGVNVELMANNSGTPQAVVSSTGLAVTGTLSATKRAYTSATAVSFSATPTFDASTTNIIVFGNLTANVTSMTMSNAQEGQFLSIRFRQDATGGRTVALPSGAKVSGSIATAANLTSYLNITYNATDSRWEGNWSNIPA